MSEAGTISAAVQADFASALRDPSRAAPDAIAGAGDVRPERRFAVYRNNVAVALRGALEARFPVVRRIVGEEFFAELSRAFAGAHPPRSPLMATYGDDFAGFIETAPGLEDLAYLADVARLEAARTRAYHAADAEPLDPAMLAALNPADLDGLTFVLHPSLEIVRSAFPIATIWAMNAGEAELAEIEDWSGEDALVVRPHLDVVVRRLPAGGAAFLDALARGAPLGDAAAAAGATAENFDLTLNLTGLLHAGLAVGLSLSDPPER